MKKVFYVEAEEPSDCYRINGMIILDKNKLRDITL